MGFAVQEVTPGGRLERIGCGGVGCDEIAALIVLAAEPHVVRDCRK